MVVVDEVCRQNDKSSIWRCVWGWLIRAPAPKRMAAVVGRGILNCAPAMSLTPPPARAVDRLYIRPCFPSPRHGLEHPISLQVNEAASVHLPGDPQPVRLDEQSPHFLVLLEIRLPRRHTTHVVVSHKGPRGRASAVWGWWWGREPSQWSGRENKHCTAIVARKQHSGSSAAVVGRM